jgi:hypothetical protein
MFRETQEMTPPPLNYSGLHKSARNIRWQKATVDLIAVPAKKGKAKLLRPSDGQSR